MANELLAPVKTYILPAIIGTRLPDVRQSVSFTWISPADRDVGCDCGSVSDRPRGLVTLATFSPAKLQRYCAFYFKFYS